MGLILLEIWKISRVRKKPRNTSWGYTLLLTRKM
nr:MAG TPA: hypothetical protein [Caudoviricetes sp.]DAO21840.1 MAG TPA: hypothetical protein [Caudoviricetes sp.]DAY18947.1 MAG TPA: hypothetical protein [Caudoviricetes sp.]